MPEGDGCAHHGASQLHRAGGVAGLNVRLCDHHRYGHVCCVQTQKNVMELLTQRGTIDYEPVLALDNGDLVALELEAGVDRRTVQFLRHQRDDLVHTLLVDAALQRDVDLLEVQGNPGRDPLENVPGACDFHCFFHRGLDIDAGAEIRRKHRPPVVIPYQDQWFGHGRLHEFLELRDGLGFGEAAYIVPSDAHARVDAAGGERRIGQKQHSSNPYQDDGDERQPGAASCYSLGMFPGHSEGDDTVIVWESSDTIADGSRGAQVSLPLLEARISDALRRGLIAAPLAQRCRLVGRLLSSGTVSGQDAGASLGMSRAAVHKHIRALRDAGFVIHSFPGVGHVLEGRPDALVPELVVPELLGDERLPGPDNPWFIGLPYHHHQTVTSTNDLCRGLAEAGSPEGTLVVAEDQTAGRGRLRRRWYSEAGRDLTLSFLLRPVCAPAELGLIVLGVAYGVAECLAVDAGLGEAVTVKWPNDVLLEGKKVCGILLEASLDLDRLWWVVAGVGLNVNGSPSDHVPAGEVPPGREPPTSVRETLGHEVDRCTVLRALLFRLGRGLELAQSSPRDLVDGIRRRDALAGKRISLSSGLEGGELGLGVACGLRDDGALLVRDADGMVRGYEYGEVTLREG